MAAVLDAETCFEEHNSSAFGIQPYHNFSKLLSSFNLLRLAGAKLAAPLAEGDTLANRFISSTKEFSDCHSNAQVLESCIDQEGSQ